MAALELDPMFRRGLRLLHSRNRDSVDQLKLLLDEASRLRQGKPLPPINKVGHYAPPNTKTPFVYWSRIPPPPPPVRQNTSRRSLLGRVDKEKWTKRENFNRDEDNLVSAKRPRLESPMGFKSHTPSPTPSLKSESSSRSRRSDESDSDEMNDLAMEIMDGINCNVCNTMHIKSRIECYFIYSIHAIQCYESPSCDYVICERSLTHCCADSSSRCEECGTLCPVEPPCSAGQSGGRGKTLKGLVAVAGLSGSVPVTAAVEVVLWKASPIVGNLTLLMPSQLAALTTSAAGK
ncbi:unnamed protein product, partial [Meganyctiphanes norvegica]